MQMRMVSTTKEKNRSRGKEEEVSLGSGWEALEKLTSVFTGNHVLREACPLVRGALVTSMQSFPFLGWRGQALHRLLLWLITDQLR
jgi:hypothetical protein